VEDNESSIARWISILYRYGQSYISREFESYNIGSGQYIFLLTLYKKDGISQENISEHLKIDKATTAKALKRLEEEGYITRHTDLLDKRAYKVYVSRKALAIKPAFIKTIKKWNTILSAGFSVEEKAAVVKQLKKMAQNAFEHGRFKAG